MSVLDVRSLIARGIDPLPMILRTAQQLGPQEAITIILPAESHPACGLLAGRGYQLSTARIGSDAWKVTVV